MHQAAECTSTSARTIQTGDSTDIQSEPGASEVRWYAVWTRSRQEKTAAFMLDSLKIRNFLPMTSEMRQWSDRKQEIQVPLFRGYMFVKINPMKESRLQVLRTPGIVGLVGNQSGPVPIPDQQIDGIQTILSNRVECTVSTTPFEKGDRIRVIRGALTGLSGVLVRTHAADRLVISLELIQKSLSVNVSRSDVVLIDEKTA